MTKLMNADVVRSFTLYPAEYFKLLCDVTLWPPLHKVCMAPEITQFKTLFWKKLRPAFELKY